MQSPDICHAVVYPHAFCVVTAGTDLVISYVRQLCTYDSQEWVCNRLLELYMHGHTGMK